MAIKLHGFVFSPPVQRVLACLIEKELDYEFVVVNMAEGGHKKPHFLSINPFGKVPVLEDGDLKLFESRAITQYIAHAYHDNGTPLVSKDPKEMAVVAVGMEVEAHQFDGPAGKLIRELIIKPMFLKTATDEAVVQEQEVALAKVLDVYEARLTECKYLSGDTFTLTDLHHTPALDYLMGTRVKEVIDARPRVSAWCAKIMARPAWQKVVAMIKKTTEGLELRSID